MLAAMLISNWFVGSQCDDVGFDSYFDQQYMIHFLCSMSWRQDTHKGLPDIFIAPYKNENYDGTNI